MSLRLVVLTVISMAVCHRSLSTPFLNCLTAFCTNLAQLYELSEKFYGNNASNSLKTLACGLLEKIMKIKIENPKVMSYFLEKPLESR